MATSLRPPIGWPLLPVPDARGRLGYPTIERSVRDSIEVILRTRPGEQLMHPEFGGGLAEFLHQPNTINTRRRIHDRITESLERWEPHIYLDRVDVFEVPDRPTHVRVEISYRIRRNGVPQQMVLGLRLEG